MSKTSKWLILLSIVSLATMFLVLAYVWIGSQVFGINTSRLDPAQGPSWPMHVVVWSLGVGIILAVCGITLALAHGRRSQWPHEPQ
ncbi:alkaline shock response membrane anchor protein AmaP [Arthrobacter sp. CJ23]|uniref:alkaline shock response membrane anchor protein AmaP n=1 Tax=Arthrobacter sp. CJ23 TaxID=2972479 RepID=UPI00215C7488|nr:alkaline shock response membrane anchor protein AmaP [Arthrobacter sp. CJ23]UVJ39310.1 alkaline shock response membrane anchor protein AmaP [Arthrobacter sp. CJ23]